MSSTSNIISTANNSSDLSLDGVGTGIDWQSIVSEMETADEDSLSPYNDQISTLNSQDAAWLTVGSYLTTLQSDADVLASSSGLDLFTASVTSSSSTSASTLLTATASSSATTGSHQVVISNIAQAEELASGTFSSESSALNISGTLLINGKAVKIASTDTLETIAANINSADSGSSPSGVAASIVQTSSSGWRIELTSDTTGASGISLENGSSGDTLGSLGFNGSGTSIKNAVSGGAESDAFSSSSTGVAALLGTSSLSGTVTINGTQVTLDTTDSLQTIASDLTQAGIQASVVKTVSGSTTSYRLAIANMTSYTDSNNILQSLGVIQGNRSDVVGVTGSVANTTDGSTAITSSTDISSIFGYTYNSGDEITISGTDHSGNAVTSTNFAITSTTTVGDLLSEIQSVFDANSSSDNVTAELTSNGEIQVIDNETGTSKLSVNLSSSISSSSGTLNFGSFSTVGTISQRVLQAGQDASFTVDGMSMTSSSNTVTTAIAGVTLNLLAADSGTTLTVAVNHDTSGIENEISSMVGDYNNLVSYINTQNSYDTSTQETGGPLFGDSTLESIKSQLETAILSQVGSGSVEFLSQIGITEGSYAQLSFDTATFESVLSTNFDDVVNLFADTGLSSDSQFQYVYNSSSTQSGTYSVYVSQLSGTDQDMEGTIDGYTATASGSFLTLSNSSSGANGLEIAYSGTTVPASATVTVSRGIASLIDGLVSSLTDPVSGAVTAQENATQTNISEINQTISYMQENIDASINNLKTEFMNMDDTVAQLDEMQSYLSYELASLD
jgi:flagellar hook-associated protein 2